jgi:thiol-disulfide isomerase/thioredoxin
VHSGKRQYGIRAFGVLSVVNSWAGRRAVCTGALMSLRRIAAVLLSLALLLGGVAQAKHDFFFELKDIESGAKLTMDELCDDKPLVVHVWAPDCPHCQRHMPYAVALYKKLDHDEVNYVTISMGESKQDALDYMAEKELPFVVLYAFSGTFGDGFSEDGWPSTFVFSKGGELVGMCDTTGPSYITEMLDLVADAK